MRQMSRIFRKLHYYIFFIADYFTFLPCNATKWRNSNKARSILRTPTDAVYISRAAAVINDCLFFNAARRQHQHCMLPLAVVGDVSWVVDSDWIIASVLRVICTRCLPYYSRDMRRRIEKMAPERKCKFNDDWMREFAWIAKLPGNGMAQCNLCYRLLVIVWWSHGCSPAPRACMPWWTHNILALVKV